MSRHPSHEALRQAAGAANCLAGHDLVNKIITTHIGSGCLRDCLPGRRQALIADLDMVGQCVPEDAPLVLLADLQELIFEAVSLLGATRTHAILALQGVRDGRVLDVSIWRRGLVENAVRRALAINAFVLDYCRLEPVAQVFSSELIQKVWWPWTERTGLWVPSVPLQGAMMLRPLDGLEFRQILVRLFPDVREAIQRVGEGQNPAFLGLRLLPQEERSTTATFDLSLRMLLHPRPFAGVARQPDRGRVNKKQLHPGPRQWPLALLETMRGSCRR